MSLTACAITSDIALDCRDSNGGIEKVFVANMDGVVTFTTASVTGCSDQIDEISLDGTPLTSGDFFTFDVPKQTSNLVETATISSENGTVFYEQVVSLVFNKLQCSTRDQLLLLAQNTRLLIVVKDNNGSYWTVGLERGAEMTAGTAETGTAYGDRNGYAVTITGREKEMAYNVDPTLLPA